MPSKQLIAKLEKNLSEALLTAMKNSARKITEEKKINLTEEDLKKAEDSQKIEAEEKAKAIVSEVSSMLLTKIEQLENKVNSLQSKVNNI